MENIVELLKPYLAILGAFTALMTAIAALTPTKKDDHVATWLQKLGKISDRFGIQIKNPK